MSEKELNQAWSLLISIEEYVYNIGTGVEKVKLAMMKHRMRQFRDMLTSEELKRKKVKSNEA